MVAAGSRVKPTNPARLCFVLGNNVLFGADARQRARAETIAAGGASARTDGAASVAPDAAAAAALASVDPWKEDANRAPVADADVPPMPRTEGCVVCHTQFTFHARF